MHLILIVSHVFRSESDVQRGAEVQRGATGCVKDFVKFFLRVPLALPVQHSSRSTGIAAGGSLMKC